MVCFLIAWPTNDTKRKPFTKSAFKSIDILGSLLLLAASILLVFVFQEAGTYVLDWDSAVVGVLLTLSPVCFIAFVGWQWYLMAREGKTAVQCIFPVKVALHPVIGGTIL